MQRDTTTPTFTRPLRVACALALLMSGLLPLPCAFGLGNDQQIETTVRSTYVFSTYLKQNGVTVEAKDGVVTLTGTVPEDTDRFLAEYTVAALPGVRSVQNRLVASAPDTERNSNAWISERIRLAFLFHQNIAATTRFIVRDGVVTLSGTAPDQNERELASEYAAGVEGVKVINNITIATGARPAPVPPLQIDDPSVAAMTRVALMLHRATANLKLHVTSRDGVVSVHGVADNAQQRDLISKLAHDVPGVKRVNNLVAAGG